MSTASLVTAIKSDLPPINRTSHISKKSGPMAIGCYFPGNLKLTVGTVKSSNGAPNAISPPTSSTHSCLRSATIASPPAKRTQVP